MTKNTELMYWFSNEEWYEEDPTGNHLFRVKDDAPERAKESFKLWEQHQK